MRPALLLIDLQRDYLDRGELVPPEVELIPRVEVLLNACRRLGVPVMHVMTLVHADGHNRMPHWKSTDFWACVEGTPGALAPPELAPLPDEPVFAKPFFSAFDVPSLQAELSAAAVDTVILAGIYTHACVRSAALDAYSRGFQVWIALDGVASIEPLHARLTLEHLEGRASSCMSVAEIVARIEGSVGEIARQEDAPRTWQQRNPADWAEVLGEIALAGPRDITDAVLQMHRASGAWGRFSLEDRRLRLLRWIEVLRSRRERIVSLLVSDIGKPLTDAVAEFEYALALIENSACHMSQDLPGESSLEIRYRPHGVVALLTPWNNPVAVSAGKLAPALGWGNAVVWKPALPASRISAVILETLAEAELAVAVALLTGDADAGRLLIADETVRAVSFTGSVSVGKEISTICGRRGIPLQAEMGGNNAVLVMEDVDPEEIARQLAPAVFSFSGQRCTAPRRLIVVDAIKDRFEAAMVEATLDLRLGHPESGTVQVGPLISKTQQRRMADLTSDGIASGGRLLCGGEVPENLAHGCWFSPTLIADPDPASAAVQEEGFGTVAVILYARNIDQALELCNDIPHGLVATLMTNDPEIRRRFLDETQAGILNINMMPLSIDPSGPFGGWKDSGIGLPEHGRWDRDFYTRAQAVYTAR